MLNVRLAGVFLLVAYCLDHVSSTIECYDCIGSKGHSSDSCYRGTDSARKVPCNGRCGKFTFWATIGEQSGMVRRACVDRRMSCEEFGEPVTTQIDKNLMVTKNAKLSLKYKCNYCNTTLCNNGVLVYPSFTSFPLLCIVAYIFW